MLNQWQIVSTSVPGETASPSSTIKHEIYKTYRGTVTSTLTPNLPFIYFSIQYIGFHFASTRSVSLCKFRQTGKYCRNRTMHASIDVGLLLFSTKQSCSTWSEQRMVHFGNQNSSGKRFGAIHGVDFLSYSCMETCESFCLVPPVYWSSLLQNTLAL